MFLLLSAVLQKVQNYLTNYCSMYVFYTMYLHDYYSLLPAETLKSRKVIFVILRAEELLSCVFRGSVIITKNK